MIVVTLLLSFAFNNLFARAWTQNKNNGYYKFEALTDIKVRCESVSDGNTIITADLGGTLVED